MYHWLVALGIFSQSGGQIMQLTKKNDATTVR